MAKEYKLDLFKQVLPSIDRKKRDFWEGLTEDERKGFAPIVVMRWLSGTNDPAQIYFLNEIANPFIFEFYKHPELLYDLMSICTSGKPKRYKWIKGKSIKYPRSVEVVKEYFGYSTKHAKDSLNCFSGSDIIGLAEELGKQKEELAKIRKESNDRQRLQV